MIDQFLCEVLDDLGVVVLLVFGLFRVVAQKISAPAFTVSESVH